jgi:1H-pyrrole-2-carbonyl-[peptidyl-carrier protein] chlorinase
VEKVVIIGGGPGGSAAGAYLSKAGIPNIILESDIHPRPHVGESLVPITTRVFDEIGFLPIMERERFPKKYGASWHPLKRGQETSILFKEFPQAGCNQDYTYHVDRARFDSLLLRHARELGSEVVEGVRVREVLFEGDRANGVRVEVLGKTIDIPASFVIDASGRNAILGRQLDLFVKDPVFDQYAMHSWFRNVDRSECGTADYIHIYFLPIKRGWVWQIPITDEITSIGVVTEKSEFRKSKGNAEEWFQKAIEMTPDIKRAMRNAERITDFKREGDYSYSMKRFAGPGYALIGDAARFVDPIFSSGVSVALNSGRFVARALEAVFGGQQTEADALTQYEKTVRDGVNIWYEFISSYYRLLPLFTLFIRNEDYRQQVNLLLQGAVYERERVPVLDAMRDFIKAVEGNERHLFRQYLGDISPMEVDQLLGRETTEEEVAEEATA